MNTIMQFLSSTSSKSSKRLNGTILLLTGFFLCFLSGICGIFFVVADHKMIEYAITASITGGSFLLGVNVCEKLVKGKNVKN